MEGSDFHQTLSDLLGSIDDTGDSPEAADMCLPTLSAADLPSVPHMSPPDKNGDMSAPDDTVTDVSWDDDDPKVSSRPEPQQDTAGALSAADPPDEDDEWAFLPIDGTEEDDTDDDVPVSDTGEPSGHTTGGGSASGSGGRVGRLRGALSGVLSSIAADARGESSGEPARTGGRREPLSVPPAVAKVGHILGWVPHKIASGIAVVARAASRIPVVGGVFAALAESRRILSVLSWVIAAAILVGMIHLASPKGPAQSTTLTLPDSGSAVFDGFTSSGTSMSGTVHNTGNIIVRATPTFTVWTFSPTLNPKTWTAPRPVTQCEAPVVSVPVGGSQQVQALCTVQGTPEGHLHE